MEDSLFFWWALGNIKGNKMSFKPWAMFKSSVCCFSAGETKPQHGQQYVLQTRKTQREFFHRATGLPSLNSLQHVAFPHSRSVYLDITHFCWRKSTTTQRWGHGDLNTSTLRQRFKMHRLLHRFVWKSYTLVFITTGTTSCSPMKVDLIKELNTLD